MKVCIFCRIISWSVSNHKVLLCEWLCKLL